MAGVQCGGFGGGMEPQDLTWALSAVPPTLLIQAVLGIVSGKGLDDQPGKIKPGGPRRKSAVTVKGSTFTVPFLGTQGRVVSQNLEMLEKAAGCSLPSPFLVHMKTSFCLFNSPPLSLSIFFLSDHPQLS